MQLKFTKMQSCGNDIMLVDCITQKVFFSRDLIAKLADRHKGVGFDQLMLIEPPFDPDVDFHLRFFEANGEEQQYGVEFGCGAALKFVVDHRLVGRKNIKVSTSCGLSFLRLNSDDSISTTLRLLNFEVERILESDFSIQKAYLVRNADPHSHEHESFSLDNPQLVIFTSDLNIEKYLPRLKSVLDCEILNLIHLVEVEKRTRLRLRTFTSLGTELSLQSLACCCPATLAMDFNLIDSNSEIKIGDNTLKLKRVDKRSIQINERVKKIFEGTVPVQC